MEIKLSPADKAFIGKRRQAMLWVFGRYELTAEDMASSQATLARCKQDAEHVRSIINGPAKPVENPPG